MAQERHLGPVRCVRCDALPTASNPVARYESRGYRLQYCGTCHAEAVAFGDTLTRVESYLDSVKPYPNRF